MAGRDSISTDASPSEDSATPTRPPVEMDEPLVVRAPVDEVTVFEDRARVVRRARTNLPAGLVRIRIEGVAPVLSNKTLTGDIIAVDRGAEVVDLALERHLVSTPAAAHGDEPSAVDTAVQALDQEVAELQARQRIVEQHLRGYYQVADLTLDELAKDVAWARQVSDVWGQQFDNLRAQERALRDELIDIEEQIALKLQERGRLQERKHQRMHRTRRERAAIRVTLRVSRAGTYTLLFAYVVPGVSWRPYHVARLIEGEYPRLLFRTEACVWQNTGEDWCDARLTCSTARQTPGMKLPQMFSDIVTVRRKSDGIDDEPAPQRPVTDVGAHQPAALAKDLPGVDDGGDALFLRAPERASVPADGMPYRIALQVFASEAVVEHVSMPAQAQCVLIKSTQINRSDGPLLAGPVALVRRGGVVGRTAIMYVAPGETFSLGWGAEPEVYVQRDEDVAQERSRSLSSWIERIHTVEVRLSNLSQHAHQVRITERIPISTIDDVEVVLDLSATTEHRAADSQGFLTWGITLAPGACERVTLRYTLRKHQGVVEI